MITKASVHKLTIEPSFIHGWNHVKKNPGIYEAKGDSKGRYVTLPSLNVLYIQPPLHVDLAINGDYSNAVFREVQEEVIVTFQ